MRNPFKRYGLFGWNYCYLIFRPWVVVDESYYRIKWFIQRGYRGWADCDAWNLDSYLTGWLPDALDRLSKNKMGHPVGMTRKGWDSRLKRMKRGFTEARKIMDMDYETPRECVAAQKRMKRDLGVMVEHFLNLWD